MQNVPFSGRLDLPVACLLVLERHRALENRTVTPEGVAQDVLDVVDHLDIDAEDLLNEDGFDDAVEEALDELEEAGWARRRNYRGVIRYIASPLGEDVLAWIRKRLSSAPRKLRAFDNLTNEITEVVLDRYAESPDESPATPQP